MRQYKIAGQVVLVEMRSFGINDKLNERTTCAFTVIEPEFEIDVGMEVEIADGGEVIFAGTVESCDLYGDIERYASVQCVDYSQLVDKRIVADAFENEFAGDIVRAFIAKVFHEEGITAGEIQQGPRINKAVFPYENGNAALNYVASVTGYNWEIDSNKQLHFYDRATYAAPFALTDDSKNYHGLRIKKTRGKYRNRQYVRAGTDVTGEIVKEKPTPKPDGVSKTFVVRLPISQRPRIFINGVELDPQEIGVNGLDSDKKYYFSFASNTITQSDDEPTLTDEVLEVTYRGLYPLLVVADNPAEINARQTLEGGSGVHEDLVQEPNINNRDTAFEFAFGKLDKYGIIPRVVTFTTHDRGLQAGHLLSVNVTHHDLRGDFLVESVTARDDGGLTLYSVKCLDGSALGGWEQFFKSLIQGNKKLVIRENEVLVLLNTTQERQNWSEALGHSIYACRVPNDTLYPSEDVIPC